ncbi:MAG: LTA synthase family protein [Muribaculaceae bacterium]|nr:LTA synthase family protein [Muribaculaceae bacterium]
MKSQNHTPYLKIASRILLLILIVGIAVRIVLAIISPADAGLTFMNVVRAIGIGLVNDLCFAIIALLPFAVLCLGFVNAKYEKPWGWIIWCFLLLCVIYVFFFHSVFHDYGGGAPLVAQIFFGYKFVSFSIRFLLPKTRQMWRKITVWLMSATYVFCILFNAVGEYLFWDEFGVRYNFIAVDYLIYTNEVVGNIIESYSVVPLMCFIIALSAVLLWLGAKGIRLNGSEEFRPKAWLTLACCYALALILSCIIIEFCHTRLTSANSYVTQLQSNGGYDFLKAFQSNELDYTKFYPMLPDDECEQAYKDALSLPDSIQTDSTRQLSAKNIVLISVESLSASYLSRYGGKDNLTPCLDTLCNNSLVFDSLYAVGNRTVRGLEALSICQPPTAGESIVKRPDNTRLSLSVGNLLRSHGYTVQYVYGGDSYFDNMGDYFSHNGYDVIDKKDFSAQEITFSNIWGVCDEDAYNKSLTVLDENFKKGKPFFTHIMTVSNHRPFTYPEGKITMPQGNYKSREAGIKYTDFAIGDFLSKARQKPWFGSTVFIIIADHCASSAGKTSVPVYNYHIPCIIYAPSLIEPEAVRKVCSQIDVIPTVLTMMGFRNLPPFSEQDILKPSYRQRAFMATYQDLGYYEDGILTVMSPVKRVAQFTVTHNPDGTTSETPLTKPRADLVKRAQAFYQTANTTRHE